MFGSLARNSPYCVKAKPQLYVLSLLKEGKKEDNDDDTKRDDDNKYSVPRATAFLERVAKRGLIV